MPYKIAKSGSGYKVKRKGKTLGSHPSKAAAQRQVRAIYANEKKGKKK